MTERAQRPPVTRKRHALRGLLLGVLLLTAGSYAGVHMILKKLPQESAAVRPETHYFRFEKFILSWGPPEAKAGATTSDSAFSNIEPVEYAGAEACAACHEEKYKTWSKHPHRFMNA